LYPFFQPYITPKPKQFLRFRNHRSATHRVVLGPREIFHRERATPIVVTPLSAPVPVPRPPQRFPKYINELIHRKLAPRIADIHRPYIAYTRLRRTGETETKVWVLQEEVSSLLLTYDA
jgi:hypothetical protein